MRILTIIALVFIAIINSAVYAAGPGFYLGAMFGPATNDGQEAMLQVDSMTDFLVTPGYPRSSQFASRLFLGNQFNNYAAFELGFTFFSPIHYDTKGVETCSGAKASVRDIELLGKLLMPFSTWFDVYGKAGIAVIYESLTGDFNPTWNPAKNEFCGKSVSKIVYKPAFSIGASYNITPSWVADVSFNRIMVSSYPGNVDYYALGISYHFVDQYCGQFLC